MCKCGCNTCDTIKGPILTEGRVKKLVSEKKLVSSVKSLKKQELIDLLSK